ncbi:MAG: hypothetical protein DDT34_02357 [Firmicutes bacterium]|nr:hypothetical protein [Bacillota bacterium]
MDRRIPSSPVELPEDVLCELVQARSYLHFDEPFDPASMRAAVCDATRVAGWQFYPLLEVEVVTDRVKRLAGGKLVRNPKTRPICFAAHSDSALFSVYAAVYSRLYEQLLNDLQLSESVIAFRSLGKSNVDFATEAFTYLGSRKDCIALGFDVTDFFGSLDHSILKSELRQLLGVTRIPDDHFAVLKAATRYARVNRDAALSVLGLGKNNPRRGGRTRLCEPADFRGRIRGSGLIRINDGSAGIPQGTPVSAVLSNIYMRSFDLRIAAYCRGVGGFFRRYCDDILLIVPDSEVSVAEQEVGAALNDLRLTIQSSKTLRCSWKSDGELRPSLQYLGLVFDGMRILLRPGGLARYYAKLRAAVRRAKASKRSEERRHGVALPLRTKKIWRHYSHVGRMSFPGYALNASKRASSDHVRRQISRHVKRIRTLVRKPSRDSADPGAPTCASSPSISPKES